GEAEPQAGVALPEFGVALTELFEDVREKGIVDANSRVANADDGIRAGHVERQHDTAAGRRKLNRIVQQVRYHLLQPRSVAHHPDGPRLDDDRDLPPCGVVTNRFRCGCDDRLQVYERLLYPQLAFGDARRVEQLVDEPPLDARAPVECLESTLAARIIAGSSAGLCNPTYHRIDG